MRILLQILLDNAPDSRNLHALLLERHLIHTRRYTTFQIKLVHQSSFCRFWIAWNWFKTPTTDLKCKVWCLLPRLFFTQILWKRRCNNLVNFTFHLKKLRSKLRFWLEKLNCGFFHSWEKTPQNNFSRQNFSVENNYFHTTKQIFLSKV